MSDEQSLVVKPRDYSDVVKFDLAQLQDPTEFEAFIDNPATYIAETITGALAAGKTGGMVAGGRIVQAILKGQAFKQFGAEFKKLRDAGKIPDDFAGKRYGFQTWVELMTVIDEESPDADRLDALKAMFYEVNRFNATDSGRLVAYHLWQLVKSLSSGEILLLKTVFENQPSFPQTYFSYQQWEAYMAIHGGHNVNGLVGLYEKKLTELRLLTERQAADLSEISPQNARLTDLGVKVCENIKNYQIALQEIDSDADTE